MSWLSDLIKGEIAEQSKAEAPTAEASEADVRTMLREIVKEEIKAAVAAEIAATKAAEPTPADAAKEMQTAPEIDIKAEIRKALVENLNSIPAQPPRKLEESYARVFDQ